MDPNLSWSKKKKKLHLSFTFIGFGVEIEAMYTKIIYYVIEFLIIRFQANMLENEIHYRDSLRFQLLLALFFLF